MKAALKYASIIAFLALLPWVFVKFRIGEVFSTVGLVQWAVLCGLGTAMLTSLGLQFKYSLAYFSIRLDARDWFCLTAMNSLLNYVLPSKSGNIVRAIVLKKSHGLVYGDYVAFFLALNLVTVMTLMSVASVIGVFLDYPSSWQISGLLLILVCGLIVAFIFRQAVIRIASRHRITETLARIASNMSRAAVDSRTLAHVIPVCILAHVFAGVRLYFCFAYSGATIDGLEAVYITFAVSVLSLVSITPAGLFIKEGGIVFFALAFGASENAAIAAAILDRAAGALVVLAAGSASAAVVYHRHGLSR